MGLGYAGPCRTCEAGLSFSKANGETLKDFRLGSIVVKFALSILA